MAQDAGLFHGLPIMGTLKSPGQRSPLDNGHPKQPQQHYPPCTTQASPPAMADDLARPLIGSRTSSLAASTRKVETLVQPDTPRTLQSTVLEPSSLQHGGIAADQQELMLEDQVREQEDHYSDELQHRIKDMWPSRPNESDNYEQEHRSVHRRVSETASGCPFSQPAHPSQNDNDYEKLESLSRGWMADSHNLFQQPFTWHGLTPYTKSSLNQSLLYQDRLDLVDQGHSINPPPSYDPRMGHLDRTFDAANPNYVNFVPTTAGFQEYTAGAENVPITALSSNPSHSFYEALSIMHPDREDTVPFSEADIDPDYKDDVLWQDQLLGDSPSSMDANESKVDEPYAQLIYRAFLSKPNKSMTLQEIYQWFRENTDKSKAEGKGWQNSIRHNLSMNGAFTKRNSKTPLSGNGDGSVSLDNTGGDGRKSTEWFLEPAFYAGVESTTRYRKGNSGSRSRGVGSHQGRSKLGSDSHEGAAGGFSHARVSAGRKGGNVAAQNRKRLAERQQHARQMDIARGHTRHLQHQVYHRPATVPYAGFEEADYYPQYPAPPHLAPSPFLPGFGGVPAPIVQEQGARQTDIVYNCFDSDDVGRDVEAKRSRTLGTEAERNEPVTPPGSTLDPPRSADLGSKHCEFLPEMTGSYNPLNSYQAGVDIGHQHQQHQSYTSTDVMGDYIAPAGWHQPSVFVDEDINLSPEDALLMNLDFVE